MRPEEALAAAKLTGWLRGRVDRWQNAETHIQRRDAIELHSGRKLEIEKAIADMFEVELRVIRDMLRQGALQELLELVENAGA